MMHKGRRDLNGILEVRVQLVMLVGLQSWLREYAGLAEVRRASAGSGMQSRDGVVNVRRAPARQRESSPHLTRS
jgi:hypothetical protein